MSKLKPLKITEAQLIAIIQLTDTISGMLGCMDEDFNSEGKKQVRLVDRMLKNNGYKRNFK